VTKKRRKEERVLEGDFGVVPCSTLKTSTFLKILEKKNPLDLSWKMF
jgi:hypothetical protein